MEWALPFPKLLQHGMQDGTLMLASHSRRSLGRNTRILHILLREFLFLSAHILSVDAVILARETTSNTKALDLSGSDPALLPQFVSEAHTNVSCKHRNTFGKLINLFRV